MSFKTQHRFVSILKPIAVCKDECSPAARSATGNEGIKGMGGDDLIYKRRPPPLLVFCLIALEAPQTEQDATGALRREGQGLITVKLPITATAAPASEMERNPSPRWEADSHSLTFAAYYLFSGK
ncbi:unnamed protein product [Arctogadus glacialis]